MKNVFWISAMAPYDKVPHAGGKIHNWYLKKLKTSDDLNIKVATFCKPDEVSKIDLNEYKIDYEVYVRPRGGFFNEFKRVIAFASKLLVFNRYAGLVPTDYQAGMKYLVQRIESSGFIPDVVVLQWTEILFFLPLFKCTWPDAKFLAIEEDVSYLGQLRRAEYFRNVFLGSFFRIKSKKVKELEINYLNSVDYVVFNNEKDLQLATQDGFRNQHFVWAPFFQKSVDDISVNVSNTVVFYGAMNREENWKSAIWFIERVMPLIEDLDIVFEIVGANPEKGIISIFTQEDVEREILDVQNLYDSHQKAFADTIEPFITHLERISLDIDEELLQGAYKEQYEKIKKQWILTQETSQLGIAVEIIDHEFNSLYSRINASLNIISKNNNTHEFEELKKSFRTLEDKYALLSPLYRISGSIAKDIRGIDLKQFLNNFFESRLSSSDVLFDSSMEFNNYIIHIKEPVIYSVLINIINNALYWIKNSEKKIIELAYDKKIDGIIIRNSGEPIQDYKLQKIFDLFYSNRPNGRGLGLYLAKQSLNDCYYDIYATNDVEYNTLGGACFIIKPLK
jgi:hypothetical protein